MDRRGLGWLEVGCPAAQTSGAAVLLRKRAPFPAPFPSIDLRWEVWEYNYSYLTPMLTPPWVCTSGADNGIFGGLEYGCRVRRGELINRANGLTKRKVVKLGEIWSLPMGVMKDW